MTAGASLARRLRDRPAAGRAASTGAAACLSASAGAAPAGAPAAAAARGGPAPPGPKPFPRKLPTNTWSGGRARLGLGPGPQAADRPSQAAYLWCRGSSALPGKLASRAPGAAAGRVWRPGAAPNRQAYWSQCAWAARRSAWPASSLRRRSSPRRPARRRCRSRRRRRRCLPWRLRARCSRFARGAGRRCRPSAPQPRPPCTAPRSLSF